jgi:hypothetical protein
VSAPENHLGNHEKDHVHHQPGPRLSAPDLVRFARPNPVSQGVPLRRADFMSDDGAKLFERAWDLRVRAVG